jgi:fibronectin-binding autotransporter adhesin
LKIGAAGTSGSITGNVTNNGTLIFDRSDAMTLSGVISGTGALVQQGSGTSTLSGINTYTGATTVSAGTLTVTTDTGLGTAASWRERGQRCHTRFAGCDGGS